MTKSERKIRFETALEIVEKVYSDYCHDTNVTRQQTSEFNDFVTDMICFLTVLENEAKQEVENTDTN